MDRKILLRLRELLEIAIEVGTPEAYYGLQSVLAQVVSQSEDKLSNNPEGNDELGRALTILKKVWDTGSLPQVDLPGNAARQSEIAGLISEILALQRFSLALSKGDLSPSSKESGLIGERVNVLRDALDQLTWQTQRIADGDFNQRVNFINDFSMPFNRMTMWLAEAQEQLKEVAKELTDINIHLKAEIEERKKVETELKHHHELLENLSVTDGLTGIANRRRFDEFFLNEWRRAVRYQSPLSLILLDIDFFKAFNDHYGHVAGDDCLRLVANVLKEIVQRPGDLCARFGGEEFVCVLTVTEAKGALAVAGQIKEKIYKLNVAHDRSTVADRVTVSMGVATSFPNIGQQSLELIQRADDLLYEAKRSGRDCIKSWSE